MKINETIYSFLAYTTNFISENKTILKVAFAALSLITLAYLASRKRLNRNIEPMPRRQPLPLPRAEIPHPFARIPPLPLQPVQQTALNPPRNLPDFEPLTQDVENHPNNAENPQDPIHVIRQEEELPPVQHNIQFTREPETPIYISSLAINASRGGKAGPVEKRPQWFDDWKLEDGSPLVMNDEELIMPFYAYLTTAPFNNATLHLPSRLFEQKNEGDIIRLRYKDELVEFILNQRERSNKRTATFENYFMGSKNCASLKLQADFLNNRGTSLFAEQVKGPQQFYCLDENSTLFHLKHSEEELLLQHKQLNLFREASQPEIIEKHKVTKEEAAIKIVIAFPGFEDFDLLINKTHFCIYGQSEDFYESLFVCPLQKLFIASAHELNKQLSLATFDYQYGYLTIRFPNNTKI